MVRVIPTGAACFRCAAPVTGSAVMAFPPSPGPGRTWKPLPGVFLCIGCGGNGHNVLTRGEYDRATHPDDESLFADDGPTLTYPEPGGETRTSGWSGTDTSHDRAKRHAEDGTDAAAQAYVLARATAAGPRGVTVAEVRQPEDPGAPGHHGMMSSALTAMHAEGRLDRLEERRRRCHPYVLPEHVNGRPTGAKRSNKPPGLVPNDVLATVWAEGYVARGSWDHTEPEPLNPYEETP